MSEIEASLKDLPIGWHLAVIDEVIGSSGTFSDGDWVESKDQDPEGEVRLIQLADIGDGFFKNKSDRFLTYETSVQLNCTYLRKGDLLIARLPDPLGRACIFPLEGEQKFVTVVDVCIVRPNTEQILNKYLLHSLNSPKTRTAIEAYKSGSTRKRISRKNLAKVQIPIAPLAEQHRIVDKVEELFSDLDNGIKSLKTAQQQLKVYRQAVLKWAFEGKLTAEWREEQRRLGKLESADALPEKIKEERSQHYQKSLEAWRQEVKAWEINGEIVRKPKKPKEPKDLKVSQDDLIELTGLPEEWKWVFPENIVSPEKYALGIGPFGSNLKVSDYKENGKPLVFVRHITSSDFDLNPKFVSEDKFLDLLPHATKPQDLLITKMGDPPGDCETYPAGRQEAIITADCLKFRIWAKYLSQEFYKYCINSTIIKKQLGLITQGVAQKKISLERFKGLKFPLPSIDEQNLIVEEIESRLSICDRLQSDITINLKKAEALRQSILKQAFEGKLVPQDPKDEPATILLERIRAEKSLKATSKKEQHRSGKTQKKSKHPDEQLALGDI